MKTKTIIFSLAIILLLSVGVYAGIELTSKSIDYPKADKELLTAKGFTNLPYSKITCELGKNCSYYITRAGKDYVRDLGSIDLKKAEENLDKDIKSFLDESLTMLKSQTKYKEEDKAGTIEVIEEK